MENSDFKFLTLKDLQQGENERGDSGNSSDEEPSWYDHDRFCRGQLFFQKHVAAIGFSMHLSLVSGFSIINLLEPLVFTNASNTAEKAVKRYLLTFYHIFLWLTGDVWDKTGKAYRSLKTVRGMHNKTAKDMMEKLGGKTKVSQYDMSLVQSGFFAAVLMYPKQFGIKCTKKELEDYIFAWRVFGYLLGIKDKYNLCSYDNYEATFKVCKEIEETSLWPALQNPPKHFDEMADAYIDGINRILPIKVHSKASALALVYDGFGNKSPLPYNMTIFDWIRFYFWKFYFFVLYYVPYAESFFNKRVLQNFSDSMEKLHGKDIDAQVKQYMI